MANQPPYQAQPVPEKKGMSTCLIVALAVGGVVLFIGVVLAVVAYSGMQRYLASAKTAEAKSSVGAITRAATAAYERENVSGELLPSSGSSVAHRVCGTATPVPATIPAGTKYMPSSAPGADFQTGSADVGWTCLKFAMSTPMYYQYSYVKGAGTGKSGATASGFEASARGDLDGNGKTSLFARGADIHNGSIKISTEIYIENEFE